jgi:hypothetical protein
LPDGDPLRQETASKSKGRRQRTNEVSDRDTSSEEFLVELLLEVRNAYLRLVHLRCFEEQDTKVKDYGLTNDD